MALQAILFDAAGTLIEPDPAVAIVYHDAAARFGFPIAPELISARFPTAFARHFGPRANQGLPTLAALQAATLPPPTTSHLQQRQQWLNVVCDVLQEVPSKVSIELFDQLWDYFSQPQAWRLYSDAQACIELLNQRSIRWGVASNFDLRLHSVLAGFPIFQKAERIFSSAEVGFEKPVRAFFQSIEQSLRLSPEELLLIGDSRHADVEGALNAGWKGILIDRSQTETHPANAESTPQKMDHTHVIGNLIEVAKYLPTSA